MGPQAPALARRLGRACACSVLTVPRYRRRHTTQLIDRTGRVDPATMETFTEADFAVGREIQMNGAQFLIYGCDEFTRDYYTKVHPG